MDGTLGGKMAEVQNWVKPNAHHTTWKETLSVNDFVKISFGAERELVQSVLTTCPDDDLRVSRIRCISAGVILSGLHCSEIGNKFNVDRSLRRPRFDPSPYPIFFPTTQLNSKSPLRAFHDARECFQPNRQSHQRHNCHTGRARARGKQRSKL